MLMELGALYERPISNNVGLSFYAAPSGEPALGPVAFMHRHGGCLVAPSGTCFARLREDEPYRRAMLSADLAIADVVARFRDRTVGPVSVVYIVLQVVTYGLTALALLSHRRTLQGVVGFAALLILATPPITFLAGLFRYDRLGLAPFVVAVFVAGSALAGLGGALWGMYQEAVTVAIGAQMMVLIFIVIIIGGLGSVTGCFIGALLVALATNYAGFLVPKLALITDIALMVAVLLWRPRGLYPVTSR
jgi:hypothetical protein